VVIDKAGAKDQRPVFLIDASGGFMKDGPKNRLRARDIHKIVDVFARQVDVPRFAKMVDFDEIKKNEFNLNASQNENTSNARVISSGGNATCSR
jgi:type I restriction enzyme M protein